MSEEIKELNVEELEDVNGGASTQSYFEYKIVKGDCLINIAKKFGVTVNAILKLNPKIKDPNLIYAGDTIKIPKK